MDWIGLILDAPITVTDDSAEYSRLCLCILSRTDDAAFARVVPLEQRVQPLELLITRHRQEVIAVDEKGDFLGGVVEVAGRSRPFYEAGTDQDGG